MLESPSSSRNGNTTTLDRDDDRVPFNPGPWTGPQSRRMDDDDEDDYVAPQQQTLDTGEKNATWEKADNLPQRSSIHNPPDHMQTLDDEREFLSSMMEGGEVYHFGINPDGIRIIGTKEHCELMLQSLDWIASSSIHRDGLSLPDFIRDSQLRTLIACRLGQSCGGFAPIGQTVDGEVVSYGIITINSDQSLGGAIHCIIHECDHLRGYNHDVMSGRDRQTKKDMERSGMPVPEGYGNQ